MKCIQVLDYAPSFGGGIADHLRALGEALQARGDSLVVALPELRDWSRSLSEAASVVALPEIRRPLRSGFHGRLAALQRETGADLVHLQFSFALALALATSPRGWPTPVVYHWQNPPKGLLGRNGPGNGRGHPPENRRTTLPLPGPGSSVGQAWTRPWSGVAARLADRRVITHHLTVSGAIRDLLVDAGWTSADRVTVLPNAIGRFDPPRPKTTRAPGSLRLGCVANFRPQKDHATLLRAFAVVSAAMAGSHLVLVGDGPGRREMEKLAAELRLSGRVTFAGTVPNAELDFDAFDLFVLATHYEGHPLTVLEAMAHGLPVVASAVGGMSEFVRHEVDGLLVPPADPAALASAILRLGGDDSARRALGASGRERVDREFSLQAWVHSLLGVYERILRRPD